MKDDATPPPAEFDYTPLVTIEEHEQGFKDLEVTTRAQKPGIVRIFAVPARGALRFFNRLVSGDDVVDEVLLEALRKDDAAIALLDRVTPGDLAMAQMIAMELAFGTDTQKKILAGLMRAAGGTASGSISSAPKPDVSATASPAPN